MISFVRAVELTDVARRWLEDGMLSADVLQGLRAEEPQATVFERRRIVARANQALAHYRRIVANNPPVRVSLLFPLPPSTSPDMPYLLDLVWRTTFETPSGDKTRYVTVNVQNNSLWTDVLDELDDALIELSSDYDADDFSIPDFILVR